MTQRLQVSYLPTPRWLFLLSLFLGAWSVRALLAAPVVIEREDVLDIVVYDEPQLTRSYNVSPDGNISFPFAGVVQVEGLTEEQVAQRLTAALSKQIKDPVVTVSFQRRNRKDLVYVVGEVRQPGAFPYVQGLRISDYIGQAGGMTKDTDQTSVVILRKSTRKIVSLASEAAATEQIEPGDTILAPLLPRQVYVLGEVMRPGAVQYIEGLRLVDAVSAVGGPTAVADISNATFYRRGNQQSSRKVDLTALWKAPESGENVVLLPGDTILIERAPMIYVGGEVRQPGSFPPLSGYQILDYIGLAGGFTYDADARAVVITTKEGKVSQVDLESPDLAHRLEGITPRSGDSIYVPRKVARVYVGGEVKRPGDFEVRPGRRISDYVGLAGGLTERSDGKHAILFRGSATPTQTKPIDLARILKSKADDQDVELQAGDMVYVPQKLWANRIEDWGILGSILTSVALTWRVIRDTGR